jgi:hypothetical protein
MSGIVVRQVGLVAHWAGGWKAEAPVADLDTLVGQVWNPEVRNLATEALRSYNAGAIRASIAATWTAVTVKPRV